MKVVTAAAALDSGEFEPSTVLNADSPKQISGIELQNSGGQSFGDIDMTTALTNSVNTYWAQVGEQLGAETMVEYMERFGFYSVPELDYPPTEMEESGVYNSDGDLVREGFDVGRVAIGQGGAEGQLLATATQMAEVAAAVANGGALMQPTFLQEAKDPDGRTIEELGDGDEQTRVISEESAAQLTEMMTNVTREGTASGLSVGGVEFAGKTGTAEIDLEGTNQPWFISFAPSEDPQIAVAATIERCQGCFGGEVAGPIATRCDGEPAGWLRRGRMRLEPGAPVGDRYTLQRRLGSGGMADVWLAQDRMLEPPRGAQVPPRALRPGRPVRRALPPRGAGRRRPAAPERRRRLRPRRGRRAPLDRDGVRRGGGAQGPDRPRARRSARRSRSSARSSPGRSSPTSAASSTATSNRRTCSSTPRAAPG